MTVTAHRYEQSKFQFECASLSLAGVPGGGAAEEYLEAATEVQDWITGNYPDACSVCGARAVGRICFGPDRLPGPWQDAMSGKGSTQRRKGAVAPGRKEIARVMRDWAFTLRDSFTDRIGATRGRISNPRIMRELECECIEAGIGIIKSK